MYFVLLYILSFFWQLNLATIIVISYHIASKITTIVIMTITNISNITVTINIIAAATTNAITASTFTKLIQGLCESFS